MDEDARQVLSTCIFQKKARGQIPCEGGDALGTGPCEQDSDMEAISLMETHSTPLAFWMAARVGPHGSLWKWQVVQTLSGRPDL